MSDDIISIKNVSRIYYDTNYKSVQALDNVSLDIERGEFISLIGPSGCGKTTLLRLLAGLDKSDGGSLEIDGAAINDASPERGCIFQQATLYPWLTVEGNVSVGLKARRVYKENKGKVQEFIKMMGLSGFERSYPHEISGGMAQRVAIARALINGPKVLLLDEPLGALDAFKRIELQNLITTIWKKTGATFILVTHDVDEAIFLSGRVVIMSARPGKITDIFSVNIPGKRDRNGDDFIAMRKRILEALDIVSSQPQPEDSI
ncbi:MAG: ABC transporter ATP-binding protein [Treponema sp.]|nr:ABC transporter ATP-binding protein [Treponema sp.]